MKKPLGRRKPDKDRRPAETAPRRPSRSGGKPFSGPRLAIGLTAATLLLLLLAGAFWFPALSGYLASADGDRGPASASGVQGSRYFEQAKVQIFQEERELGTLSVSEERTAEFFLRNVGGKPLRISQVRTSCMCTFAQLVIDDEESPLFNMEMHNPPALQAWTGVVEPGLTAIIRVIYRPSLMPVQGSVARNVKFNTNDPARPVVELGIHATVQ